METINGIIISINEYKDKEFIVSILSNEALYSASITRNKRRENTSLNIFSFGEFVLYKGPTKYFKIKNFYPRKILVNVYDSFDRLLVLDFLTEILNKINYETINISKLFSLLKFTLTNLDNLSVDSNLITLYFFYNLLIVLGLDPTYTKLYNNIDVDLLNLDLTKRIDKKTFLILFRFFSKILHDYLGVYLNSYYNFK